MSFKLLGGILGTGAAAIVAAYAGQPSLVPISLVAVGGTLGGASVALELNRKKEEQIEEAAKVAATFNGLYEFNKGLVNPQQLSLLCGVPLEKTTVFLKALSDQQNGRFIRTDKGDVFNFPHPTNVLDQLTANAQAWVKSQTDPLLQENATLKAELVRLQSYINTQAAQQAAQQVLQPLRNDEKDQDPWNKLL